MFSISMCQELDYICQQSIRKQSIWEVNWIMCIELILLVTGAAAAQRY